MTRSSRSATLRILTATLLTAGVAASLGGGCGLDAVGLEALPSDGAAPGQDGGGAPEDGGNAGPDAVADARPPVEGGTVSVDPACAASQACVRTEPDDWKLVSARVQAAGAPATCATGWDNPRVVLEPGAVAPNARCACTCGLPQGNPCVSGVRPFSFRKQGNLTCASSEGSLPTDGSCQKLPFGWDDKYDGAYVGLVPLTEVSCGVTPSAPPALPSKGDWLLCDRTATAEVPCKNGVCVERPGADRICVARAGEHACPAGFDERHVVASGWDDTRACGACSCKTKGTTCKDREIAFYSDAACTQDERTAPVDGVFCRDLSDGAKPGYYKYSATPTSDTCTADAADVAITGEAKPKDTQTLCCAL